MTKITDLPKELAGRVVILRLRDGRAVKTEQDHSQWIFEYLDDFANDLGQDSTPIDIFPAWTRVMAEWVDGIGGLGSDRDNARALAAAIGELTKCLERVLTLPPEDPAAEAEHWKQLVRDRRAKLTQQQRVR